MAAVVGAIFGPLWFSSPTKTKTKTKTSVCISNARFSSAIQAPKRPVPLLINGTHSLSSLSTLPTHFSLRAASTSSAGTTEYAEEPATKVKFQRSLSLPGCPASLSLVGTGYREKVFAIVGVKVYAAGFYVDQAVFAKLDAWKGSSAAEMQQDSFDTLLQAPSEKSLQIVLVRDIDGKTFWDALDEAVSPRIKSRSPIDESALSTFRGTFQGRPLKKGTSIFLTWLSPTKMIVSVSSDGIPSAVDATIESQNVTSALFDVFLGSASVSPSLKASVANGLAETLK